jgi:hypothetical protein
MREAWERGDPRPDIAKAFGLKEKSVSNYAFRYGWTRPKKGKSERPNPAAPAAAAQEKHDTPGRVISKSVDLGATVTCPSCHLKTNRDPCSLCGSPVRRKL